MAETSFSAIEHALENQSLGGLQIRVATICGLIQMCDGYDVGTIGWSVPSLTHAWQIAPSAFALAFLWSNQARMRTSGYGFATGVGRLGGIAAGPLGGFLLANGLPPTYVFLSACVFAAIAASATPFLALPGRQPIRMAAMEVAS